MLTHSRYKAATSLGPGGGDDGRGGMKREGLDARMGATAENLMGNSGLEVDADAVMLEAAAEVAGVKVEGRVVVAGDVVVTPGAGTDEDGVLAMVTELLYETEAAEMVCEEIDGDGSGEKMQVLNGGGGTKGLFGVEAGGLQSEVEAAAKTVERSSTYHTHTPQHAEAVPKKSDQFAKYCLPRLDNGDIRVSDLVWAKLEGYPWWPGEIFSPSDASELALKNQIRGNYLVVFFCDDTFSWCDESQLMPFMTNYAQMEKQSASDEFVNAVNHALEELLRRISSGMSCLCSPDELYDNAMSYLVENHGLREGVTCSTVNRNEVLKCFCPENLLHYVKSLALFPGQGGDFLELVIACSQLTSFYLFKGFPELATFQTNSGWNGNAMDASSSKESVEENDSSIVHSNHYKPRKGRGRPRKWAHGDGFVESMEKKATFDLDDICNYGYPEERKMFGSSDELIVLDRAKWRRMFKNHNADPIELLSQLCSVAIEPMNRNNLSEKFFSYFIYYRNYAVTASNEASVIGKVKPKRGQDRMNLHSPEVEITRMQDSYWSELSLHNDPIYSLRRASTRTKPTRKRRASLEGSTSSSQQMQPAAFTLKKQIQVMERPIIHVDAKMTHEVKPTALVLSFGRSAALPSEMDIIKMFRRCGALKEMETEVNKDTNTVKVVFKRRVNAERAFSFAGNYCNFGPRLQSYRLVNMPFYLGPQEASIPVTHPEANDF